MSVTPYRKKWKSEMTDRQRFVAQMNRQPIDRCFNMEFGYWDENFREWSLFVENGITTNWQADQFFNFDRVTSTGPHNLLLKSFERIVIEDRETTQVIRDGSGLVCEVPKDGHATIPHYIRSSVVTPEDWAMVKEQYVCPDHEDRRADMDRIRAQLAKDSDLPRIVDTSSMIGQIRNLLTVEGLAYACFDYPEMVEDMVETSCQMIERYLDQVLSEFTFDVASSWEDICCNSGPLISMPFFKEILLPRYKRIGEKLGNAGVDIWWTDCDGDARALLPSWLDVGLNTMFPWEVNGGGHPGAALDKWGPELRVMGGVDKTILAKGPEKIKEYVESLDPYVKAGGFIPFCDHRCPPDVSQEDYLYYLDLKEELWGMK